MADSALAFMGQNFVHFLENVMTSLSTIEIFWPSAQKYNSVQKIQCKKFGAKNSMIKGNLISVSRYIFSVWTYPQKNVSNDYP